MLHNFFNLSRLNEDEMDFYNFSLKNINVYINQNIQTIAKSYGCGISFIYTFFKKIGVTGLKDFLFKVGFQEGVKNNLIDKETKTDQKYSIENIEKFLLVNYSLNTKLNFDLLKEQMNAVQELCKQIKMHKNIYGFGIGHAEICIKELFGIFGKFKVQCKQFIKSNDSEELPNDIASITKGVILIYSFRGVHKYTERFIKKIREHDTKAVIWLVTTNKDTTLGQYADRTIFINNNVKEINYIDKPILISIANSYIFFNDFLKNVYILQDYDKIKSDKEFMAEIESLRTSKN